MNWYPLLGLLAFAYAGLVIYLAATKKPASIWNMAKIQAFIKVLGEKGTIIFFYVWGVAFLGLGIWLFTL
ncbi:MAG: hypothetical protein GY943_36305 [Chloroflexi bacterium]|nr:hypothetical protein [Chloroflexota bacterium]